ncbi:MAG: AraC family transcriptional activator FtrA [Alteromonadaceae bacterium]|jgi:AraC family transcriptional activator FtrA
MLTTYKKNNKLELAIISFTNYQSFSLSCAQELFVNNIANIENWYKSKIFQWDSFTPKYSEILLENKTLVLLDVDPDGISNQAAFLHLLIEFHQRGNRLVSFGSGVSLLAQTGLLNGKTIAVDKRYFDEYCIRFPQVNFSTDIVFSGEDNLYCSASSVAALQLGIHLISEDIESDTATKVANLLQVAPLNIDIITNVVHSNCFKRLRETLSWAEQHLDQIDNLDQLAERTFMSRRNFDRQFRAIYHQSPKAWLTDKRISLAINFLKIGEMGIEDIAGAAGFSNAVNFRNNFKSNIGISPSEYRANIVMRA